MVIELYMGYKVGFMKQDRILPDTLNLTHYNGRK